VDARAGIPVRIDTFAVHLYRTFLADHVLHSALLLSAVCRLDLNKIEDVLLRRQHDSLLHIIQRWDERRYSCITCAIAW